MKILPVSLILAGLAALCPAASLRADVIISDPSLPVLYPGGVYVYHFTTQPVYSGGGLVVTLQDVTDQAAGPVNRVPNGSNEVETYNGQWGGLISVNLGPSTAFSASGTEIALAINKVANVTGTFQTELLSMNLSGNSSYGPFMIRESPTRASTGQTTITGLGGGQYQIHSFFDVFTELSVDGGQNWIPSSASALVTLEPVPEPAVLGMLAAGIVAWGATRRCRRRP